MFLDNKYQKIYKSIILNSKLDNRSKERGYFERHHIVPKSLGGSNNSDNLVLLTAREHFICHKLLTKFTEGENKKKMVLALWSFIRKSNNQKRDLINSREYERTRQLVSETLSIERKGKFLKGTTLSEEHKLKISKSLKNRQKSEDTKKKMKESWKQRPPRTKDHCEAISKANKGRTHNTETKEKMSKSKKGKNPIHTQIKWVCENCSKEGTGISNYNRWHGNNCKRKING